MHISTAKTVTALALASLAAACSSTPPAAPMPTASPAAPQMQAYEWDLTAAFDGKNQPATQWLLPGQKPARLHFAEQRVAVQNLCNAASAAYRIDGERLQVERPMSTLRACAEPGLMQLEQRVLQQLPQVQRYALQGGAETPRLVLHFADGSRWEMAGTPTPETRFGAAGERVFLEVAPQRVACNHPLMPQAQCLSVRDVHYGDNGVRQSVGAWRVFHGEIEGYQHEPGMRNVLRLQRYPATRPGQPQPADAPRHVYLLDMVVETERVAP